MAVPGESKLALVEVFCFFCGLAGCILIKTDHKQPEPYMDEIFHVPQAQKFCEGRFDEWDPMITTLPGLYLSTLGVFHPFSWTLGIPMGTLCSTFWLRTINVGFAVGNLIVLLALVYTLHEKRREFTVGRWIVTSLTLAMFPVLYFFSFLYYTDPGSTFFVLLMYLLSLSDKPVLAAMAGIVSVVFRQTNIVWVVFSAGLAARRALLDFGGRLPRTDHQKEKDLQPRHDVYWHLWSVCHKDVKLFLRLILSVLRQVWPYVLVVVGFCTFVVVNGSIVVGAKEDHQVGLHFPQLFYFASFSVAFSFMHLVTLSNIQRFIQLCYRRPFLLVLCCVVSGALVWKFTFAHRYLLADNRHYPFYLWAKVYRRHESVKYLLIPAYLYAIWGMFQALNHKDALWKLVFVICVIVNLIPSMLLEFRYFILPYLFFRLNMTLTSFWRVGLELALYIVVNALTLYMFLERPFYWAGDSKLQRFMW